MNPRVFRSLWNPRVAWRSLSLALRRVRLSLLALLVVLIGGTLLFWISVPYRTPIQALYYVLNLITFNTGPDNLPRSEFLQVASLAVTIGGILALAGGAASIVQLLSDPREQQLALASTFKDHIIVCGIGRVGYRVINELLDFGETVVGVNQTEDEEWLDSLTRRGVAVIIGDARRKQTLLDAGVERASAIVACTSVELTNLDVALDARELNPGIKVVLRMFDAKLAANVSKGFNIQTVFSVSALAAPAFAVAATRAKVTHSFKLNGQLLNVTTVKFQASSPFIGKTVQQVEQEANCSIIGFDGDNGMQMHPPHDYAVRAGDCFHIVGGLQAIRLLNNGQ